MLQLADAGAHVGTLLPEGSVGPTGCQAMCRTCRQPRVSNWPWPQLTILTDTIRAACAGKRSSSPTVKCAPARACSVCCGLSLTERQSQGMQGVPRCRRTSCPNRFWAQHDLPLSSAQHRHLSGLGERVKGVRAHQITVGRLPDCEWVYSVQASCHVYGICSPAVHNSPAPLPE